MSSTSVIQCKKWMIAQSRPNALGTIILFTIITAAHTALYFHNKVQKNSPPQLMLITHLESIQQQLSTIEHAVKLESRDVNLKPLKEELTLLAARVNQLQTVNPEQLSQTKEALSTQLDTMQSVINHLDKSSTKATYLKPSNLPFHVTSLDSIQQSAVASVSYDFKVIPLEKGDSLAIQRTFLLSLTSSLSLLRKYD